MLGKVGGKQSQMQKAKAGIQTNSCLLWGSRHVRRGLERHTDLAQAHGVGYYKVMYTCHTGGKGGVGQYGGSKGLYLFHQNL